MADQPSVQHDSADNLASHKCQWCTKVCISLCLQYFLVIFGIGTSFTLGAANYKSENNCSNMQLENSNTSPWRINCTEGPTLQEYVNFYIALLIVTSLIGFFLITALNGNYLCCGERPKRYPYLLAGTLLFGVVAAVWFLLRALGNTEKEGSPQFLSVEMYAVLEVLFIFTQIFFLLVHGGHSPNNVLVKAFIVHVVATNCCLWFRITASEDSERQSNLPDVCQRTTFEVVCLPRSTSLWQPRNDISFLAAHDNTSSSFRSAVNNIAEKAMPFLYPFIAEFCLCASGLFVKLWLHGTDSVTICPKKNTGSTSLQTPRTEERTPLLPTQEEMRSRRCISATAFAALLISVTATCLVLKIVFEEQPDEHSTVPSILYQASQIAVVTLALIFASLGLYTTYDYQPRSRPSSERSINVESFLLMIALAGLYLAQCLHLYASLHTDYINKELQLHDSPTCNTMRYLSVIESFLIGVLACIQTLFIVQSEHSSTQTEPMAEGQQSTTTPGQEGNRGCRSCRPSKKDLVASSALVVLLCNFILWGCKTYELSGYYCNPLYFNFYSSLWVQLTNIFYPLWIFFHFHSAVSCGNIFR